MPREVQCGWCPGHSCRAAGVALKGEPDGLHLSLCLVLCLFDGWPGWHLSTPSILP